MRQELKAFVREQVQAGKPTPALKPDSSVAVLVQVPDELVIEITGNTGMASVTLRPHEVSRLRGRFGRGPGFEQWVVARVRDAMISFGGG